MAVPHNLMPLTGSALATPSAPCLGPLPPLEQLGVVVRLRHPASAEDIAEVVSFALDNGLRVLDVDHRAATVDVRGSVLAFSQAFAITLRTYLGPEGPFRARRGMIHVPVTLAGVIVAIDGLDQRPPLPGAVAGPADPAPRPTVRRGRSRPPAPPSSFSTLSVSAAPRVRAGRICAEHAGETGSPVSPTDVPADHTVVRGGYDRGAPAAGLALVLHLPLRHGSTPPDHPATDDPGPERGLARPEPLAPARTRRRGPMAHAAAEQRDRRLARQLHPAVLEREGMP